MSRGRLTSGALALVTGTLALAACSDSAAPGGGWTSTTPEVDGGSLLSKAQDAGHDVRPLPALKADAGGKGPDANRGHAPDAGGVVAPPDAGPARPPPIVDGGVDAALRQVSDAPLAALVPAAPCTGTADLVYSAPQGLPPMTDSLRGDIVACTSDGTIDTADVQAQLVDEADTGVTAVTGVAIYRVQYRTTRANGSAAVSSARVYLPVVPISAEPPLIIAAHGTEGLASGCTTSMDSTSMRDLGLPWAALGYPVIAPDYAGLGTPGVQGYTDNHDTARSVVDSAAALRKFVGTALSPKVVIDGHSQGGGAALATQALATEMGLSGTLTAVVAFAPEYYSHLDSLGFLGALESVAASNPLTITTGVTKCEVAALMEYQYFANYAPSDQPGAGFPASASLGLDNAVQSLCTIPLGGAIQTAAPHVADWTDATLRNELIACVHGDTDAGASGDAGEVADGGDGGVATCTGAGQAFYAYLKQNIVTPDALGAPILLVQGLQDIVMPADQEAACNVIALEAGGVTPQVCTDAPASHTDVTPRNIAFGIQWAQAILAGSTPPACAASDLPACSAP